MDKSEIRVFIVEDDITLGKALVEMVKKLGYQPVLCPNPTEAQNQYRIQGAHLIIVDCLLPKMPGVDLAVKLRSDGAKETPIILMSGIYKDKGFIKDSVLKTGAIAFFTKPFNIEELSALINTTLEKFANKQESPLESLMTGSFSPAERTALISQLGIIDAFDIPWICSLMMIQGIKVTLQFQNEKEKASISFNQGKIVQIEMQNPESYFGALLIEGEYLTSEQLDAALKLQSPKRVGERLVDLNLLSPHVINLINAEQTAIRLSKIIKDTSYKISVSDKTSEASPASLDVEGLSSFLIDWINSKIQVSWLEQRYLQWINSPTVRSQTSSPHRRIWNLPPLKNVPAMISQFDKGASLGQVLAQAQYKEDLIYQVFHLLILIDHIRLKREVRAIDETAQLARLQKLYNEMQNQDFFATLGVNRNAKATDIKKTYHELAKIFHPDKLSGSASPQLKDLAQKVFGQMTKAYDILSNEQKKAVHVKEIEMGRAETILQAEALLEEGKTLLKSGLATKAQERFEEAIRLRPPTSELLIHLAWAKIMSMINQPNNEEQLMYVENTLNKIPPEDRHNFTYYFVKGLFQHIMGEDGAAKKNVLHALSLNPKFTEAERVLRFIEIKKNNEKVDLLSGDITSVVGNFFKKK
ncbi:MAG: response regulator [Oligoflexia bacterium]|nr:response regulator [Oligoflexia bacterium]